MEKERIDLAKKILMVLGICAVILIILYSYNILNHESDPYVYFDEVPLNATINHTIIHLPDTDLQDRPGWEIRRDNGSITSIIFRDRQTAFNSFVYFIETYKNGSDYVEYNGHYFTISSARP